MKFRDCHASLIAVLLLAGSLNSAPVTYKDFQPGSTVVSGQKVAFRLFIPKGYTPTKKYPIMITLHGAGERGVDDSIQLTHYFNRIWADSAAQAKNPAFVLAPQCPPSPQQWVNTPWGKGSYNFDSIPISIPMQGVMKVLDSLEKKYSFDPTRYYVSGLSMGGYGTWYMTMKYPEKFAAAVPVCGAGDPSKAASIGSLPIWAFHGADDPVVPVKGSRDMYSALQKVGTSAKYTEYPESQRVGHASWVPASETAGLVDWVYSKSRTVVSLASLPKITAAESRVFSYGNFIKFKHRGQESNLLGRR